MLARDPKTLTVVSLKDTSRGTVGRRTVLKPEAVGTGDVLERSCGDPGHEGRTGPVHLDTCLDLDLLVGGATSSAVNPAAYVR